MKDKIIEALREIEVCETWEQPENKLVCSLNVGGVCRCLEVWEAVNAAIAASEHRIVPTTATEKMELDGKCELVALTSDLATSKWAAKKVYEAMVQAAPKVTE